MNKKGLSLVELIITVALISVVMVFMYQLLAHINNIIKNPIFAVDNQVNRLEIIKYVEEDMESNGVGNIAVNGSNIIITSNDSTVKKEISISVENGQTKFIYSDISDGASNTERAWIMDNCTLNTDLSQSISTVSGNNYTSWTITIAVYTTGAGNTSATDNNSLDDIVISYLKTT